MAAQAEHDIALEEFHCGSCMGRAERALSGLEGVAAVSVNVATRSAHLRLSGARSSEIQAALAAPVTCFEEPPCPAALATAVTDAG